MPVSRPLHPLGRRPWWQVLSLALFTYGLLGALIWLHPVPDTTGLAVGGILVAIAIPVAMRNWRTYSWWARTSLGVVTSLFFLVLGARMLLALSAEWSWLILALAGYGVALAIPAVWPKLSGLVWRELVTPRTKAGRAMMALGLSVLPIAGVLGASIGLFARRLGYWRPVMVVGACLALSGSIIWAFAISHQFWPERPWRAARGD